MSDISQTQKPVVILTPAAVAKVKSMMERDGKTGYYLRAGAIAGGCAGLSYDLRFQKEPYENDAAWEQDGLKILVNPESAGFLSGMTVDYVDTLKESGFQFRNPNAKSTCGCGTSFS